METQKNGKNTSQLLQELKKCAHFSDFVNNHGGDLQYSEFSETLNRIYNTQGRTKAEIARAAGTSEAYLYQIFSGVRIPSRNRLLCICIGMQIEIEDAQILLKQCGYAPLYARERRDAVIIHGLIHGTELSKINDTLFEYEEQPLLD